MWVILQKAGRDVLARLQLASDIPLLYQQAQGVAQAQAEGATAWRPSGALPATGSYVSPTLLTDLGTSNVAWTEEIFGPVLHVATFKANQLDKVIADINAAGYGLTFGVHTRIDHTMRELTKRVNAGNCYVNRSMIGAVVGVQPFGGVGLSGTGPKAGGPHALHRFANERAVSVNIMAMGGDPALLQLG